MPLLVIACNLILCAVIGAIALYTIRCARDIEAARDELRRLSREPMSHVRPLVPQSPPFDHEREP
jgi:hypothetical protein